MVKSKKKPADKPAARIDPPKPDRLCAPGSALWFARLLSERCKGGCQLVEEELLPVGVRMSEADRLRIVFLLTGEGRMP